MRAPARLAVIVLAVKTLVTVDQVYW